MTEQLTPAAVQWLADAPARAIRCSVCGHPGPHVPILSVPGMAPPHPLLTLLRCTGCASGFYDPPGIRDFSDLNQDRDEFWRFYIEAGGGVWETIWPLLAVADDGAPTLLDIGCGFGFAVDFWLRTGRGDAVGVELAEYGRMGARLLSIPIYHELLQDCAPLAGRRFDLVYASEVVEHVPDPAAFVALLAERLTPRGTLVLTTPSVEYVCPDNLSHTLLAALSPGFHGFLLSAEAFGDLARRAGLAHVEVRTFGERQMLWASHVPLALAFDDRRMRPPFIDYMTGRVANRDPHSPVWQGYAYRLLRDLTNTGQYAQAQPLVQSLFAAVAESHGAHVLDPDATLKKAATCTTLADFGRIAPFFLPCLYYHRAAIAHHHERDTATALSMYRGTIGLAQEVSRFSALAFLEAIALVWPARAQEAGIAMAEGDLPFAADVFTRLAAHGRHCTAADGFAVASMGYVDSVVPRACEGLFLHGRPDLARRVFATWLADLADRRAGIDWTDPATIERVLVAPATPGDPPDVAFGPFFAGLLDAAAGSAAPSYERLHAIQRLAAKHATHKVLGPRLAHYASIATRYLPAPARQPLFDMSFTLVQPPPKS